jgi:hypothetical protein
MNEDQFVEKVASLLKEVLPGEYVPVHKANLIYQITLDNNLNVTVDPKKPMRGQSAFQTDLCIFKKKGGVLLPKVVVEFKSSISTHDVITYSDKAKRHKQIYPYLRYGLISYDIHQIPKRFFIHNEGLDFCLALADYMNNLEAVLRSLIGEEVRISDILEETIFGDKKYDFFRTNIEFKNFKE